MDPHRGDLEPCDLVPQCPICKVGPMRLAHRLRLMTVCICMNCDTSLSVPNDALARFQNTTPAG
jgi:hypothetical protein